jgi:Transglutaminase-like enzymes, putative cysteine proteases
MADGRRLGEAALVVVAVFALLLSAAFLPVVSLLDGGSVPGELPGKANPELPSGLSSGGQQQAELPDIGAPGQIAGGSLSQPPEQTQISGGLSGASRVPLFTVQSPVNTYWRQTAYSRYTGTGWEQSTDQQPLDEGVPNDDLTSDDTQFSYQVTLLQGGTSLPTAWQPESVRVTGDSSQPSLRVSASGGIQSEQSLSEDTTYVAESAAPTRDPTELRRANGRAPPSVRDRYTQLPVGTSDRIEQFTDDITAGERSRYEQAAAIQGWLKTNRGYSLDTSIDPSKPIAEQLLFEVDAAYCQQFATTMAVMLRTQDIPARYVVGFAPGKQVGTDEYLVTSDRAHAWVEVYFEDVGWVRFDPTPSGDLPVSTPEPPYEISLNRSAVVGAPVSVSVTKNESGVSAIPVFVNEDRVGWTDASGTVETTLPYADEVTISAGEGPSETKYNDDLESAGGGQQAATSLTGLATSLPLPFAGVTRPLLAAILPGTAQAGNGAGDSTETYPLAKNATVAVVGDPTVGGSATVVASVKNVPVSGATVSLDGTRVGTTDGTGNYRLSLDDVTAGSHEVTVSREPVRASTEFTVSEPDDNDDGDDDDDSRVAPNISVVPATLIALPGAPATANVSRFGTPVSGTGASVNGNPIGTTDANGTVEFTVPVTRSATVAASVTGIQGKTQLTGLYRNAVGVLVGLAIVIGGVVVVARRRGITRETVRNVVVAAGRRLARLPGRVTGAMIQLAKRVETAVRSLSRRLRSWPALFSASLSELLMRLDPRRAIRALMAWLRNQAQAIRDRGSDTPAQQSESESAPTAEQRTIRSLWGSFVTLVRPPSLSTRTPVEISQYAIDSGLPRQPVQYLTALYRAVEYGRESPDASRLDSARDALSEIQDGEDEE